MYHLASPWIRTPVYHSHDFYEFYFYIAGDATIHIEEYSHRLRPGDVVFFPPGYMHRAFHHTPEVYYERMLIYVPRDVLRSMGNNDFSLVDVLDGCVARSQFCFPLSKEKFEHCRFAIYEIIRDAKDHQRPCQSLMNRCRVNLLLTTLLNWFEEMKDKQTAEPMDRIGRVIAYINEHIAENLTLDTLSGQFFISKYHLMREFKKRTNRSIYQFILSKRVNLAKLTLQSGVSPSDAAVRCGFDDYSSFYRAFRGEIGLSPNQYLAALKMEKVRSII